MYIVPTNAIDPKTLCEPLGTLPLIGHLQGCHSQESVEFEKILQFLEKPLNLD